MGINKLVSKVALKIWARGSRWGASGAMIVAVPAATAALSLGCISGKTNWHRFIEKTNTMIREAAQKYGCVGRGEGEMEMESMMGSYLAGEIAKNNAYMDYKLRCVDPFAYNVKIDKENGIITGVAIDGKPFKIKIFKYGSENHFNPIEEKHYATAAVYGQKD